MKLGLYEIHQSAFNPFGKGQRIEVGSLSSVDPIVASQVKLREQALIGPVAHSPEPTASGFTLNISPTSAFGLLSGVTTVPVTFASGAILKTTPTAGATIRVRGLLFFNGGCLIDDRRTRG